MHVQLYLPLHGNFFIGKLNLVFYHSSNFPVHVNGNNRFESLSIKVTWSFKSLTYTNLVQNKNVLLKFFQAVPLVRGQAHTNNQHHKNPHNHSPSHWSWIDNDAKETVEQESESIDLITLKLKDMA